MALIGLVCSSYVCVSAGTHQRAPFAPLGQETVPFVKIGNMLATRSPGFNLTGQTLYFYRILPFFVV